MKRLILPAMAILFVACAGNGKTTTDTENNDIALHDLGIPDHGQVQKDVKKTDINQDVTKVDAADVSTDVPKDVRTDQGNSMDPNRQPKGVVGSNPDKTPYSLHITWTHDPSNSAVMQWQTKDQSAGATCWIAKASDVKTNADDSVSMPFTPDHIFKGKNDKFGMKTQDQTLHWVEITGLTPGTKYMYRCGEMTVAGGMINNASLSPLYKFATPANGDSTDFMVYGDSRGGYDTVAKMAKYIAEKFQDAEFQIFTGDFDTTGMQNEWDQWFAAMQPIVTRWGLIPVMGNHELFTMKNYLGLFVLPDGPGTVDGVDLAEKTFSYDIGPVHVVVLDSNSQKTIKAQVSWLDDDLKATTKPWKVVALHHPAYAAGGSHPSNVDVDTYFVPVFEANNVDFVFNGHNHYYERTVPIRAGKKDDTGVVYVTTGGFGAPLYSTEDAWFIAYRDKTLNFVECKVDKTSFAMTTYDEGGIKIDSYTKNK